MKPQRIQLSRKRGWRMPPNTLKVDRSTPWGNPFVVGPHGTAGECVYLFTWLASGAICLSSGNVDRQGAWLEKWKSEAKRGFPSLRGKNLACWCRIGAPCHADAMLLVVNQPRRRRPKLDVDELMARYGLRVDNGKVVRIEGITQP